MWKLSSLAFRTILRCDSPESSQKQAEVPSAGTFLEVRFYSSPTSLLCLPHSLSNVPWVLVFNHMNPHLRMCFWGSWSKKRWQVPWTKKRCQVPCPNEVLAAGHIFSPDNRHQSGYDGKVIHWDVGRTVMLIASFNIVYFCTCFIMKIILGQRYKY